jgi:uncharacterized membrane protein YccC
MIDNSIPAKPDTPRGLNCEWLIHSLRTTIAAVASLLTARLFRLPEAYWAPITTMIVMQSTVAASIKVSFERLVGTALGAVMGAILATFCGANAVVFGAGIFALGVICAILFLDRTAYRYAGITLVVVLLIVRNQNVWLIALHRFIEVSIGIVVGLIVAMVWREQEEAKTRS